MFREKAVAPAPQVTAPAKKSKKPAQTKMTVTFDYRQLLEQYDAAAVDKSPIKYFDAVLNVSDKFLDILNEYETAQAETIAVFLKIALKLKAKYTDNPNLTPEENALLDAFDVIFGILHAYRDAVDKFYLKERKNIYQKFAFQAGGDLQEKFETESALYKSAEKLQRDLQEIIFKRDKTEERIFLLRRAEPLLNLPLDEINNFIRDRELNAIAEEVLNQFAELRRQNFERYLADSKSYGRQFKGAKKISTR